MPEKILADAWLRAINNRAPPLYSPKCQILESQSNDYLTVLGTFSSSYCLAKIFSKLHTVTDPRASGSNWDQVPASPRGLQGNLLIVGFGANSSEAEVSEGGDAASSKDGFSSLG